MAYAAEEMPAGNEAIRTDAYEDDPDCVLLTEEQYRCISELGRDSHYVGPLATVLSFPPWQSLMQGEGETFDWIAYSGYLGVLKFGLQAKSVEGASELHRRLVSIWERQFRSAIEANPITKTGNIVNSSIYHPTPLHMRLSFRHLDDGWFRVSLSYKKKGCCPQTKAPKPEAGKQFKGLASEAFLLNRSRISDRRRWSFQTVPFIVPLRHLPGCEQIDQEQDLLKTEGYLSESFNKELKRTIAHIGQHMEEEEGEEVNWEAIRGNMQSRTRRFTDLFKIIGEALDEHIEEVGSSLLAPEEDQRPPPRGKGKRTVAQGNQTTRSKKPKMVELTPEFIDDSDSSSYTSEFTDDSDSSS